MHQNFITKKILTAAPDKRVSGIIRTIIMFVERYPKVTLVTPTNGSEFEGQRRPFFTRGNKKNRKSSR